MLLIFFIYISLLPAGCAILLLLAKPQKYCHWAGAHRCCLLGTGQRGAVISSVPKSRSLLTLYLLVAFDAFGFFWVVLMVRGSLFHPKTVQSSVLLPRKLSDIEKYTSVLYMFFDVLYIYPLSGGNMTKKPETPSRLLSAGEDAA